MNLAHSVDVGAGFDEPVRDAQACFRSILSAFAEPGTIAKLEPTPPVPPGLSRAMAAVALTLCDFETPSWLDASLRGSRPVVDYLRLHTGMRLCEKPGDAAFGFASSFELLPDLSSFALGTLEFPDASTMVVLDVLELEPTAGWKLTGPGIAGQNQLRAGPFPPQFETALRANRKLYPRGVDIVLCCGDRLAALPRTTRIERGD